MTEPTSNTNAARLDIALYEILATAEGERNTRKTPGELAAVRAAADLVLAPWHQVTATDPEPTPGP